jgi:hypothetical protein
VTAHQLAQLVTALATGGAVWLITWMLTGAAKGGRR